MPCLSWHSISIIIISLKNFVILRMDRIYIDRFYFVFWIGILSLFMLKSSWILPSSRQEHSFVELVNLRIQFRAVPNVT